MGEDREDEVLERGYDSVDSSDDEDRGLEYAFDAPDDSSEDEEAQREPGGGPYEGDLLSDCEAAAECQSQEAAASASGSDGDEQEPADVLHGGDSLSLSL